jgi:hypothetical protein
MIFGAVVDDALKDQVMITVIATGIRTGTRTSARDAAREKKPATLRLTPREPEVHVPVRQQPEPLAAPARHRPEPAINAPVRRPEPERENQGGMYARDQRRNSKRELEIPTFLRRQMD